MMKVTVKTIKGTVYAVDAEGSDTVLAFKQRLDAQESVGDPSCQKVVYQGKVRAARRALPLSS